MASPVNGAEASTIMASESSRSLVVDEAIFEEQFLRCPVCHEKYNQEDQAPKTLPCNHTFCLPCLIQIYDHSQPPAPRRNLSRGEDTMAEGVLKCPTCRVELYLSRNKVKELPNDHRVVQMMDFLAQAVTKSQQVCVKHDRQPVNFFCKKCMVPICRDCTVLDHKEADDHVIADIAEAIRENSAEFTTVEKRSREILEKLKKRMDGLANASTKLDILDRQIKMSIKDTFIEYRLLLEKRQEALSEMVSQIIKDQKEKINIRFVGVLESGAQLQKLFDEFKSCKENNDIRKIFGLIQQLKDGDRVFAEAANLDDHELMYSCEFEPQNEGSFLADLSSLGEVKSMADPALREAISPQQLLLLEVEKQKEKERLRQLVELDQQAETQFRNLFYRSEDRLQASGSHTDSEEDGSVTSDSWPSSSLISHLIGLTRGDSLVPDEEDIDETDSGHLSARTGHRRGRRPRDTNSSQVANSLSQAPLSRPTRLVSGQSGGRRHAVAIPHYYPTHGRYVQGSNDEPRF